MSFHLVNAANSRRQTRSTSSDASRRRVRYTLVAHILASNIRVRTRSSLVPTPQATCILRLGCCSIAFDHEYGFAVAPYATSATRAAPTNMESAMRTKLETEFGPQVEVNIRNDSSKHAHHAAMAAQGGGNGETHFYVHVVSDKFAGMPRSSATERSMRCWLPSSSGAACAQSEDKDVGRGESNPHARATASREQCELVTHTDDPARARLSSLSLSRCVLRILSPGSFVRAMYSSFVPHVGQIVLRQNSERERECWRVQVVEMDILTDVLFFLLWDQIGDGSECPQAGSEGLEVYGRLQSRRCIRHRRSQRRHFVGLLHAASPKRRMYRLHEHALTAGQFLPPRHQARCARTHARQNQLNLLGGVLAGAAATYMVLFADFGQAGATNCFTDLRLLVWVPKALLNSSECNSWID